jgi:serine/threonine protein kinase/TolB-like protein
MSDVGKTILHYRILKKLGEGGMGTVYLAEDTKLNRKVAVKFLPAEMASDPTRLKRFEREAKTVASLNHPNIVTLFAVEEHEGVPFLVMELVEGELLGEVIAEGGMEVGRFFEIAIPMTDALAAAHASGVTHRDLKPGNIMLTADGRVKILDFGLAKLLEEPEQDATATLSTQALTREGSVLGTVPYMAPEQLKGTGPDPRSDIFSLGIVLYQMISGRRPFKGATSAEVISSILRDSPPPVTDLKMDLPPHLGRIVKRCLEKDASRRYQSSADLRNELEELKREIETGQMFETKARPAVLPEPRSPRSRTKPLLAILAVVVIVAVAALFLLRARQPASTPEPQSAASPPAVTETIAVLPFKSLGGEGGDDLTNGLAEEITSKLTDLEDLQVVSTATAARHARAETGTQLIGERLGATYVVLGTVQWDDSDTRNPQVRVTPQLVRVADDIQIWSDSFDRSAAQPLEIQSEIAGIVVRQVGVSLLGWEGEEVLQALLEDQEVDLPIPESEPTRFASATGGVGAASSQPPAGSEAGDASSRQQVIVTETELQSQPSAGDPAVGPVTLHIQFASRMPEGVLTLYADEKQILKEQFRYQKKSRLLRPKRSLGGFDTTREISSSTRTLRIYLLVEGESKLTTVTTDLLAGEERTLTIELFRKGTIEASLE